MNYKLVSKLIYFKFLRVFQKARKPHSKDTIIYKLIKNVPSFSQYNARQQKMSKKYLSTHG